MFLRKSYLHEVLRGSGAGATFDIARERVPYLDIATHSKE